MNFVSSFFSQVRRLASLSAQATTIFYVLPWLMVLVVMGTISQKEMGLYAATEKYFNSIILWLGPVPLPGGITTIGVIFAALVIKFVFYSKWNRAQAGIIISHLGILLLLLGGILTAATAREGFMMIPEGRNVDAVSDYRQRVVTITADKGKTKIINFDDLKNGNEIAFGDLKIEILLACDNCSARAPSGQYDDLQGLAVNMELFLIEDEKQPELNFSGLVFAAKNAGNPQENGTYIIMEDVPKNPSFTSENGAVTLSLGRAAEPLPFSITLKDFRKINYPGTQKAREFESDLIVNDGEVSWPVTISMNEPLRYKGYTFYQSSFDQRPDVEVTVLSVVKNAGRAFPYLASLVIFIGLLLHFIIRLRHGAKA